MTKNQVQPKSPTIDTTSFHTQNHPDSTELGMGPSHLSRLWKKSMDK
jgi:hypothetical protein